MSEFKKNIRKALAGILTVAMVITSGAIPSSTTSVQAATVCNDTTTALSSLAGSTGLKIYRLTSDDAGKELTSGIYYVDEDLTFTGADSTSSGQAGGNGLKIADGATVYLYIADGKTLTATGGNGYDATAGVAGEDGSITFSSGTYSNTTFNVRYRTDTQGKSKAGGNGASGGGAGIFVPQNASFAVMGQGKLNATGGAGGNAQIGGQGGKTNYYYASFEVYSGNTSPVYSQVLKSLNDYPNLSITKNTQDDAVTMAGTGATGAGGSGGGGAGGGGAAVGSNGSNGSTGGQGGATSTRETIGNGSTASTVSSGTSGKIYIQGVNVSSCVAGAGGSTRSQQYSAKANTTLDYKDYYDMKGVNGKYISLKFYITEGQAGGVGGAGGNGAVFGNGGSGGAGGTGGNSGSFRDSYDKYTSCAGDAKVGADGVSGASGTESKQNLNDTQYPYNTVAFTNVKSNVSQKYYLTKKTQITVPNYEITKTGEHFFGWKVTTPATTLPSAFKEDACGLEEEGKVYQPNETITATGVYGNVTVEPLTLTVTGKNETIDYVPEYDLSQLFTIDQNAGAQTYTVEAQDGAEGTVSGHTLSIKKCGKFNVTLKTAENGDYGTTETTATLTVNIKTITPTVSVTGWTYGSYDEETNAPKLEGNTGNAEVTYTYYKDAAFTEKTTPENSGAKTEGGVPVNAGIYYVKADVEDTGNTSAATAKSAAFTIAQKTITPEMVTAETALEYNGKETDTCLCCKRRRQDAGERQRQRLYGKRR